MRFARGKPLVCASQTRMQMSVAWSTIRESAMLQRMSPTVPPSVCSFPFALQLTFARAAFCTRAYQGFRPGHELARSGPLAGLSLEEAAAAFEASCEEVAFSSGNLTTLSYTDLAESRGCQMPAIFRALEQAFGPGGLGILVLSQMPPVFVALRRRLLRLAEKLASLPEESRLSLEDPASTWNFGYSCGREKLENGVPDINKISYYANPQHNSVTQDPELQQTYPSYCRDNIWPNTDLPELEPTFLQLGQLIIETGLLLAKHLDRYLASKGAARPASRSLHDIIAQSRCHKGRLLHYRPQPSSAPSRRWCGEHTDHGSLTGLVSAMFLQAGAEVSNPDPACGLHIRDRHGASRRVAFPANALAFQMGETTQVHSGGLLRATPHFVQSANAADVSRNTFAVFLQPRWDEPMIMPEGTDPATVGIGQWRPGLTFGNFTELTMQHYY